MENLILIELQVYGGGGGSGGDGKCWLALIESEIQLVDCWPTPVELSLLNICFRRFDEAETFFSLLSLS